jgi:hypothetical protein
MHQLTQLWKQLLGEPPTDDQFTLWTALHTPEVVKQAILKTAAKNLSLGKTMSSDYKIRFASKVMLTQTERNAANAANRERLNVEMSQRHQEIA